MRYLIPMTVFGISVGRIFFHQNHKVWHFAVIDILFNIVIGSLVLINIDRCLAQTIFKYINK